ncbi:hypothetical protein R1sor_024604 [Riccia sorocarpa]|uniref:Uncharacterized protein n=1 Tax=Riccia sorocarpa TaxID=122646 RepID=A0ABD3GR04_9MARC
MDLLTVEVREEDIPVAAVQVPPTFVVDEVPLGENPMEVAPVPASDHGVDEGEISLELVGVLDSQEAVPVIGEAQKATTSSLVDGWQDDGKFVQLKGHSRIVNTCSRTFLGFWPNFWASDGRRTRSSRISDRAAAATHDTGRGLPMNVTIGVPFDVESMREYFPTYNDKQWANGKINFTTHCEDRFLKDNWETWFRTSIGGRKDGSRTKVRKNFLFFAGLEKHGLRVDWTTVDKSRNIREIPVAERHAPRVELWKRRTVFRGSLLYLEEPTLRTDERVPRKPRAKKTSPAGSTPAEDETSPATKKTVKRKLNLDPPRSRSPSPEALERNQPPRNGKKKMEEGAAVDMDRKGKRKVDDQPSTVPAKKNKRGDDSEEDSNKSNHAKEEAVQNTHFAALGKSEREKRQWGYIDKFINETVQDKIQKRERELKGSFSLR